MLSSWAFAELQRFVEYKAALQGIETIYVSPKDTSRTCYRCKSKAKRDGRKLVCTTCGEFDADVNAAKNIAAGGAACKPARESTKRDVGDVLVEHFSKSHLQSKAPAFRRE